MIRAAPKHLVDCSPLDTTLFQAANPDAALPGASWLRDLRNLRKTQYADLGNPPTESERHQIQMFCQHLFPPHPVRIPVSFATRVNVGSPRPRDSSGRVLPRSDSHQSTHEMSADSPRMHNEPGSSSRDGQ